MERLRMPKVDKARQIIRAAERLFTKRRFHEVTMDDVRREARVGKGTIYLYFKNKDDLFVRVVLAGFEDLRASLRRTASANLPFETQLARTLSEIRKFFLRRRPLFRIMHSEHYRLASFKGAIRARWTRRSHELMGIVSDILRGGVESGHLRDDIPAETLAACLLGLLRGYVRHNSPRRHTRETTDEVVHLFLHGAARPGGPPSKRGR